MFKFACKDIGMDCKFETTGPNTEIVMKNVMEHAQVVHKDMLAKMTPKELTDLNEKISSKIHQE
jgi:predicted small metal-binding protein